MLGLRRLSYTVSKLHRLSSQQKNDSIVLDEKIRVAVKEHVKWFVDSRISEQVSEKWAIAMQASGRNSAVVFAALIAVLICFQIGKMPTLSDLKELKADIGKDMKELKADIGKDMKELKKELKMDISNLDKKVNNLDKKVDKVLDVVAKK